MVLCLSLHFPVWRFKKYQVTVVVGVVAKNGNVIEAGCIVGSFNGFDAHHVHLIQSHLFSLSPTTGTNKLKSLPLASLFSLV
jgi:hypothetical protein